MGELLCGFFFESTQNQPRNGDSKAKGNAKLQKEMHQKTRIEQQLWNFDLNACARGFWLVSAAAPRTEVRDATISTKPNVKLQCQQLKTYKRQQEVHHLNCFNKIVVST